MTLSADLLACARLVESADPDRFAATMAAPPAARARLWPLYALNLELARAPYASPEPLVAEMRLQWWVDQIEAMAAATPPSGEVAGALGPIVADRPELVALLADMADARRWEVWKDPFADQAALTAYIDRTAGHLIWAAALSLGAPSGAETLVRDFAFGAGLANWLAAVPDLMARGRQPLVDDRDETIAALAKTGLVRMARARARRRDLPRTCAPALWTGWDADRTLGLVTARPDLVRTGLPAPQPLRRSLALAYRSFGGFW